MDILIVSRGVRETINQGGIAMTPTTDPALRSFIPVAPDSHFPIQNLPYGVFRRRRGGLPAVGVAIGDFVLDLSILEVRGLLPDADTFNRPSLNRFIALGPPAWTQVREKLSKLLRDDEPTLRDDEQLLGRALVPLAEVEMLPPV